MAAFGVYCGVCESGLNLEEVPRAEWSRAGTSLLRDEDILAQFVCRVHPEVHVTVYAAATPS